MKACCHLIDQKIKEIKTHEKNSYYIPEKYNTFYYKWIHNYSSDLYEMTFNCCTNCTTKCKEFELYITKRATFETQ